jgi:hypothetical protein
VWGDRLFAADSASHRVRCSASNVLTAAPSASGGDVKAENAKHSVSASAAAATATATAPTATAAVPHITSASSKPKPKPTLEGM